jgi:hypothetical protein
VQLPDGRALTGRGLCLEAIKLDPNNALAYDMVANHLCANETVTLWDGRTVTNLLLYLEALRLYPHDAMYHIKVGTALGKGRKVRLYNGNVFTQAELGLEALRLQPSHGYCYTWLARYVRGPITLPNGRVMSRRDLLIEGYLKTPRHWYCVTELALDLTPDETLRQDDGSYLTRRQLLIEAINISPQADTYASLAKTLLEAEKIQLRDGRWMGRADLWSTAINLARYPAEVFVFLGDTLSLDESITIDGQV